MGRVSCGGALLCAVLVAGPGHATTPAETAAHHFEQGLAHVDGKEYDLAIAAFEQAYALSPHHSVLYNIALAHAAAGHVLRAIAAFERYLNEGGEALPPARKEGVRELIAKERAKLADVAIDVKPVGTRITLDGAELPPGTVRFEVEPGAHELVLRASGYRERSLALRAEPGAALRFDVVLEPQARRSLHVTCEVPDVSVMVDGRIVATTSGSPTSAVVPIASDARELRFSRAGYAEQRVALASRTRAVTCGLAPLAKDRTARLVLVPSEKGAAIQLDGRPFRGEAVVPGKHTVAVDLAGFEPYRRTLSVAKGRTHVEHATLKPTARYRQDYERSAKTRRLQSYLVGAGGFALGAGAIGVRLHSNGLYSDWRQRQASLPPRGVPATPEQAAAQRENESLQQRIETLDRVAIGLGIGGLLVVGGAIWLYLSGDDPGRYALSTHTALHEDDVTFRVRF